MKFLINKHLPFRAMPVIGIIAVMALGVYFSFIVTGCGLAVEGDGYYFINAARIIAAHLWSGGQAQLDATLLREITDFYAYTVGWWPPVYPALLAAVSCSADPYLAGRWLHLMFPVIIGILLWLIFYRNQKSHRQAFLAIALIVLSPNIIWLNWFIYSEILFIVMQLAVVLTISRYLWTRRWFWLVMTVLFIALSGLTRYVGVVMALALCITLWRLNDGLSVYRKMVSSITCLLLSILPVALFLLFSTIHSGELAIGSRTFAWGWPISKMWWFFSQSIYSPIIYLTPIWWPQKTRIFFIIFALAAIIVLYIYQTKKQRQQPPGEAVLQLQYFIKLCLLIYIVMVSLLALFLDHILCFTGITPRHFSPFFVWAVLLLLLTCPARTPGRASSTGRFMSGFASIFAILLITIYLAGSATSAFDNRNMAAEKNRFWENALALAYAQKTEATPWIASNMPGEVFHYMKTPVFALPSYYDFTKDEKNYTYQKQMAQLRRILHQYNGRLIYFYQPAGVTAQYCASLQECLKALDLEISVRGDLYAILQPAS